MSRKDLIESGIDLIKSISSTEKRIIKFGHMLKNYKFDEKFKDDVPAWLTCILALKAVDCGNLGIGSIVLDNKENLFSLGYNQVISPYYRSSGHAEMIAMDLFEEENKEIKNMSKYKIYTSLESCPMCMTRLIVSGVKEIYHVSDDKKGGMVHLKENLSPIWIDLLKYQLFEKAKCSPKLEKTANEIFMLNRKKLDNLIFQRRGV